MKVLVLEYLLRQTRKKKMDTSVVAKVYQEIELLKKLSEEGKNSLDAYLKNQNGKKMKGSEHIYKYRLTDGDRILYTYGRYVKYIREEDQNALVIVAYAKHEEQGDLQMPVNSAYHRAEDMVAASAEAVITETDITDLLAETPEVFIEDVFSDAFLDAHSLFVIDPNDADMEERSPEELDVYLSDEQAACIHAYISDEKPYFISGGAGSGKTVMAVHILNDCIPFSNAAGEESAGVKCAYFTQSEELLKKAEKRYAYLEQGNPIRDLLEKNAAFFNINTYCRSEVNLLETDLVQTEQFLNDFIGKRGDIRKKLKKAEIAPMDLWAEIRGTIKGGLDQNWKRFHPLDRTKEERAVITELDRAGMLEWQTEERKFFVLSEKPCDVTQFGAKTQKRYRELWDYFHSVDPAEDRMAEKAYLERNEKFSTLQKEHRQLAYDCCRQYQEWLELYGKYDENDLVRKVLAKPDFSGKFDMIIVDEMQDYTELQLYLLHQLVKDEKYLVMVGDPHQNINPTSFVGERLGRLFQKTVEEKHLERNFRCQKKIVDCANALITMRRKAVGLLEENKADKESSKKEGELPMLLEHTEETDERLIRTIVENGYANIVILVPSEQEKERLQRIAASVTADPPDFIFTAAEIKGMEYSYVVCYHLIGQYREIWQKILELGEGKRESRYRYYFNLFYVGVTRAQNLLCIIEPERYEPFFSALEENMEFSFRRVDVFDPDTLLFSELSNTEEAWLQRAQEEEANGQYETALKSYRMANAPAEMIGICEIKKLRKERNFAEAFRRVLEMELRNLKQVNLEPQYAEELKAEDEALYWLVRIWTDTRALSEKPKEKTLTALIAASFEEKKQIQIQRAFARRLCNGLEYMTENIRAGW